MKNKLRNRILAGDKESIRVILSRDLQIQNHELKDIIQLSKNKGIKIIQSILVNRIPNSLKFYSDKEREDLIIELISELSQDIYAAGWYEGIEYQLWNWIKDEMIVPEYINYQVIENDLKELKELSKNLNLWAIWENGTNPQTINLIEWKQKLNKKN